MIDSLKEMYGLKGNLFEQYINTWKRLLTLDFGPSLTYFPTPVKSIIRESVFWTIGLLGTTTVLSWIIGNILGVLAGYYGQNSRLLNLIDTLFMIVRPIPYYILAFVLLIVFAYYIPIFPIGGAYTPGIIPQMNWGFFLDILRHAFLPALSLLLLGIAGWFQSMKIISINIKREDFVVYAKYGGVPDKKIVMKYIFRNALLPQITGLSLSLGQIFGGALITEIVFSYPGLGGVLYSAILQSDYNTILGIVMFSVLAISLGTLILDITYPLFDPRIRYSNR